MTKSHIIAEIRRLAAANGGIPPGMRAFTKDTGVGEGVWKGVYWRRWSEAQAEAGFRPTKFGTRSPTADVLERYLQLASRLQSIPVDADLRLERRKDSSFPSVRVFRTLGSKADLLREALTFSEGKAQFSAVREQLLREVGGPAAPARKAAPVVRGYVYLLRSGKSYKIGRSNAAGRRLRELAIKLPVPPRTIHVIPTDDPEGIEAYWHRRFEAKRQDGEWFLLSDDDVRAFKWRRHFQ